MIYKKSANFPYPLLTNDSKSYKDCRFLFNVDLMENNNNYRFNIKYEINSDFINKLLEEDRARLVLVIQSRDNRFFYIKKDEEFKEIPKSRISLDKKTKLQLSVQLNEDITFKDNYDLSEFYMKFKDQTEVKKYSILGFSNVVTFDGSQKKPFTLFEKKVDPSLKSRIKIELGNETIIINYKNEELQFRESNFSSYLNNPYIYMGLQKALYKFIDLNKGDDESIYIQEMDEPEDSGLNEKLYNLMKRKFVEELNYDNVDEVIEIISNDILEKYSYAIKELTKNGD